PSAQWLTISRVPCSRAAWSISRGMRSSQSCIPPSIAGSPPSLFYGGDDIGAGNERKARRLGHGKSDRSDAGDAFEGGGGPGSRVGEHRSLELARAVGQSRHHVAAAPGGGAEARVLDEAGHGGGIAAAIRRRRDRRQLGKAAGAVRLGEVAVIVDRMGGEIEAEALLLRSHALGQGPALAGRH